MFIVKKKPLTSNIIWNPDTGKPLCKFDKGKLETNDIELAEKLKTMGYAVSDQADVSLNTDDTEPKDNTGSENTADDEVPVADTPGKETKTRKSRK